MPRLLKNQKINGFGEEIPWNGNQSPGVLRITGIWDGAVVEIQSTIDDDNLIWKGVGAVGVFTYDLTTSFKSAPCKLRMLTTLAGPETNLNCDISPG